MPPTSQGQLGYAAARPDRAGVEAGRVGGQEQCAPTIGGIQGRSNAGERTCWSFRFRCKALLIVGEERSGISV